MTANQINYWKYQEDMRHNRAGESHNIRVLEHNQAVLAENVRHNRATEAHNANVLVETQRHNLATEQNQLLQVQELARANKAQELLSYVRVGEDIRSNQARENETNRHNIAMESVNSNTLAEQHRSNVRNEEIKTWQTNVSGVSTVGQLVLGAVDEIGDLYRTNKQAESSNYATSAKLFDSVIRNASSIIDLFS